MADKILLTGYAKRLTLYLWHQSGPVVHPPSSWDARHPGSLCPSAWAVRHTEHRCGGCPGQSPNHTWGSNPSCSASLSQNHHLQWSCPSWTEDLLMVFCHYDFVSDTEMGTRNGVFCNQNLRYMALALGLSKASWGTFVRDWKMVICISSGKKCGKTANFDN